jgi:hypothetical protein
VKPRDALDLVRRVALGMRQTLHGKHPTDEFTLILCNAIATAHVDLVRIVLDMTNADPRTCTAERSAELVAELVASLLQIGGSAAALLIDVPLTRDQLKDLGALIIGITERTERRTKEGLH